VSGRLAFDGASPPSDPVRASVRLTPVLTGGVGVGVSAVTPDAEGRFNIEGVVPGRYTISVTAPWRNGSVPAWVQRDVVVEGQSRTELGFDVPASGLTDVSVVFSDKVSQLTGVVSDPEGRPAPGLAVVVFPTDRTLWSSSARRRPPQRPDTSGRYQIVGIPAGEYYLAVVADFDPREASDDAFLEDLVPAAIRVTIAEGEQKVQNVRLSVGGH
jgi:hypothetical protein